MSQLCMEATLSDKHQFLAIPLKVRVNILQILSSSILKLLRIKINLKEMIKSKCVTIILYLKQGLDCLYQSGWWMTSNIETLTRAIVIR